MLGSPPATHAAWSDMFKSLFEDTIDDEFSTSLSSAEIVAGLKEALSKGTRSAINRLGRLNGFYGNPVVRIPLPDSLRTAESTLRTLGQDKLVNEFVLSLNRAAEKAVPETLTIFTRTIRNMSIADAREILHGPDDAATQYFRRQSSAQLEERIEPIVSEATSAVGVTARYKDMVSELGFMSSVIDLDQFDIDHYVTEQAIAGMFTMISEEEKRIRENPAARTTELLKKVFRE